METAKKKTFSIRLGSARLAISRTFCYIVLAFLAILCLFSFYMLIVNATRQHGAIMSGFSWLPGGSFLYNAKNLFDDKNIPTIRALGNSLLVAGSCAILTTYFSAMTAYGLHAYQFRFKQAAFLFILFVMMVPYQVSTLGFLQLVAKMDMMDTYWPLILPKIAAPVVFFFMKQYMESVLPLEIVEAARVDGSNEFHTFNRIVLPMIKPAIAVQAIFAFVENWNNYFIPALVINANDKKTIPILIAQLRSADYLKFDLGKVYMLVFVAIIPVMLVYIFLSKFIIKGVTMGSLKG